MRAEHVVPKEKNRSTVQIPGKGLVSEENLTDRIESIRKQSELAAASGLFTLEMD